MDHDGTISAGADLQGPGAGGFHPLLAEGFHQPDDAKAGPEPLFGMRAFLQDERA